jgi:hypothetical protein
MGIEGFAIFPYLRHQPSERIDDSTRNGRLYVHFLRRIVVGGMMGNVVWKYLVISSCLMTLG